MGAFEANPKKNLDLNRMLLLEKLIFMNSHAHMGNVRTIKFIEIWEIMRHLQFFLFPVMCLAFFVNPPIAGAEITGLNEKEKGSPQYTKDIRLVVKTSTWRKGAQPFDIEGEIKFQLRKIGFEIGKNHDTTLFVTYKESRGKEYSGGGKKGSGTNIFCQLKLVHQEKGLLFEEILEDSTEGVSHFHIFPTDTYDLNQALYLEAIDHFQANPLLKHFDELLAGYLNWNRNDKNEILLSSLSEQDDAYTVYKAAKMLGQSGDQRAVVPLFNALLHPFLNEGRREIQSSLKRLGWKPQNPEEVVKFYIGTYHLSRKDSASISQLGSKAVEPLLGILKNSRIDTTTKKNAILALGETGDKSVFKLLNDLAQNDPSKFIREAAQEALETIQRKNNN